MDKVDTPKRSLEIVDAEVSAPYSVNATAVNSPDGSRSATPKPDADLEKGDPRNGGEKSGKVDGAVSVRPAKHKHMTEADKIEYLNHQVEHGEQKYHKLGWIQLVVILIVEAIALGSLSLPA
jgi:hypothetical protein